MIFIFHFVITLISVLRFSKNWYLRGCMIRDDRHSKTRGGARKGAGRPRTEGKIYSFRVNKNLSQLLDKKRDRSTYIRECVMEAMLSERQEMAFRRIGTVYSVGEEDSLELPYFETKVVAGFPVPLDSDEKAQAIDLIRTLCPHPLSSCLIRVQGNSMIDAGIHDGDILIIDKSNRCPAENEAALCELNGEYTIKFLRMKAGRYHLVPANPEFPEITISE